MRKTFFLFAVILCAGGSSVRAAPPAPSSTAKPTLSIPHATWVRYFFEDINKRAALSGLPSLQKTTLPAGDLEVRVWEGFGGTYLQGYVLRRIRGTWSAVKLTSALPKYKANRYQQALPVPKVGWTAFWSRLQQQGLLTLPDSSALPDEKMVLDGMSYVVEVLDGNQYRTYQYGNPDYQSWPQAKQMLQIAHLLQQEFPTP